MKEVPNTHKKIKEIVKKLKKNASEYERNSVKKWLERNSYEPIDKITFDMDTQTMPITKKTRKYPRNRPLACQQDSQNPKIPERDTSLRILSKGGKPRMGTTTFQEHRNNRRKTSQRGG